MSDEARAGPKDMIKDWLDKGVQDFIRKPLKTKTSNDEGGEGEPVLRKLELKTPKWAVW